jgi:hypothetical protein
MRDNVYADLGKVRVMQADTSAVGPSFFTPSQAAWQTYVRPAHTGGSTAGIDAGQVAMRTMIRDEQGTCSSDDLATVAGGWMDLPHAYGPNYGNRVIL